MLSPIILSFYLTTNNKQLTVKDIARLLLELEITLNTNSILRYHISFDSEMDVEDFYPMSMTVKTNAKLSNEDLFNKIFDMTSKIKKQVSELYIQVNNPSSIKSQIEKANDPNSGTELKTSKNSE